MQGLIQPAYIPKGLLSEEFVSEIFKKAPFKRQVLKFGFTGSKTPFFWTKS